MANWTEEELRAWQVRTCSFPQKEGANPAPSGPDRLEAPIQSECLNILERDGWRIMVTNPCSDRSKGKGFGEVGMADALAIRYGNVGFLAVAQVIWIEAKRGKGGVLSKAQRAWHIRERARGALTVILGEDCRPSVEGFRAWYRASGLQRRGDL